MNVPCHMCGEEAIPQMTLTGPNHTESVVKKTKHFCCLSCFWKYMLQMGKELNMGGRLDAGINWDYPAPPKPHHKAFYERQPR